MKITVYNKQGKPVSFSQRVWDLMGSKRNEFTTSGPAPGKAKKILEDPFEIAAREAMKKNEKPAAESNDEIYATATGNYKASLDEMDYESALKFITQAHEIKPSPWTKTQINKVNGLISEKKPTDEDQEPQ